MKTQIGHCVVIYNAIEFSLNVIVFTRGSFRTMCAFLNLGVLLLLGSLGVVRSNYCDAKCGLRRRRDIYPCDLVFNEAVEIGVRCLKEELLYTAQRCEEFTQGCKKYYTTESTSTTLSTSASSTVSTTTEPPISTTTCIACNCSDDCSAPKLEESKQDSSEESTGIFVAIGICSFVFGVLLTLFLIWMFKGDLLRSRSRGKKSKLKDTGNGTLPPVTARQLNDPVYVDQDTNSAVVHKDVSAVAVNQGSDGYEVPLGYYAEMKPVSHAAAIGSPADTTGTYLNPLRSENETYLNAMPANIEPTCGTNNYVNCSAINDIKPGSENNRSTRASGGYMILEK